MRNKFTSRVFILIFTFIIFLSGCVSSSIDQLNMTPEGEEIAPGSSATDDPARAKEDPLVIKTPDRPDLRAKQTPPASLEHVELPKESPVTGEVPPEIFDEIFADLVARTGAEAGDIQVIRAEALVWNDGSLDCPKPGEFYIQMLINGYWVVLEVAGVEYDYRVSDKGSFKLCAGGSMPSIDAGGQTQTTLINQAKEDLAKRLGIPSTEIELLRIEEVTWRDGSLGCPQPGMAYTQALVNGSLIQLKYMQTIYQYHSGRGGVPFLCENPPKDMNEAIAPEEMPSPEPNDQ